MLVITIMATPGPSNGIPMTDKIPQDITWHVAKIAEITHLTPRVNRIVFQCDGFKPFMAGQHLDIRLTAPDGYRAERSYSITSSPTETGKYELAIELLTDGEVSSFFHGYAQVGTEVEIRGPLGGHFIWEPEMDGNVVLIAGGSGVAPFLSMARTHAATNHSGKMLLLQSARCNLDVISGEELEALSKTDANLSYVRAITRQKPQRPEDIEGRFSCETIVDLMNRHAPEPARVYVCGSNAFVEGVAHCFVDAGIDPMAVKTERFGE